MSFLVSFVRKIRGRRRVEDPLQSLGISIWEHDWLNTRVAATILSTMDGDTLLADVLMAKDEKELAKTLRKLKGRHLDIYQRLAVLYKLMLMVVDPWARRDPKLYKKLVAWLDYYELIINSYKAARDMGKPTGALDVLAQRCYDHGRMLLYQAWQEQDVGPSRIFLIQSINREYGPPPDRDVSF